jgi:hypothetical protein
LGAEMRNPEHEEAAKVEQLMCTCMTPPKKIMMHGSISEHETLDPSLTSRHSAYIEFRPNYADVANPYMYVGIDILCAYIHTSTLE